MLVTEVHLHLYNNTQEKYSHKQRDWSPPILKDYPGIYLEELNETMRNLLILLAS